MTGSVIRNSMIIRASAITLSSMGAQTGRTITAVRIAHQGQPVPRDPWVREGRRVLKVFPESEGPEGVSGPVGPQGPSGIAGPTGP